MSAPALELQQLSVALSPQGHLHVRVPDGSELAQIAKHFERGDGHGVFRLGAAHPETPLPGALGFWRDVGRAFVVRLCATEDLEALRANIEVEVPPDELAALAAAAPPMTGGEYLTPAVLAELCARMAAAVPRRARGLGWHRRGILAAGKPCLEPRRARLLPPRREQERSRRALRLPGDLHDTAVRAGESSASPPRSGPARVRRRAQQGRAAGLARARAARRADERRREGAGRRRRRLRDARLDARGGPSVLDRGPAHGGAGVVVRMPAAWRAKRPPRPEVQVTVGKAPGKGIGADAILDFSVDVTLEGETLTERELRAILDGTDGLALVRGRWVEVDHERLRQVLDRWSTFEEAHAAGGLSVVEGLRLLAGAEIEGGRRRRRPPVTWPSGRRWSRGSLWRRPWRVAQSRNARRSRSRSVAPRRAASLSEGRAAVALVASEPGPRRMPRRRHGSREDHAGHRAARAAEEEGAAPRTSPACWSCRRR